MKFFSKLKHPHPVNDIEELPCGRNDCYLFGFLSPQSAVRSRQMGIFSVSDMVPDALDEDTPQELSSTLDRTMCVLGP